MQKKTYFHSPFSEETIQDGNNKSLLLQFILEEIFLFITAPKRLLASSHVTTNEVPFFLTHLYEEPSLHKIQEHATLLTSAFPSHKEHSAVFLHALSNVVHLLYNYSEAPKTRRQNLEEVESTLISYLKQMFFLLEPFIKECKNDRGLIFFLLKNHEKITLLSEKTHLLLLLKKLHPKKDRPLQDTLCDHFHAKGFAYLIPRVKILLQSIKDK